MGKIRFDMAVWKATVNGQPIGQSFQDGTYICDELYDCSGYYYPAADYEALEAKLAALVKVSEAVREYLMGGIWVYDKSPDEFIKAALEANDG